MKSLFATTTVVLSLFAGAAGAVNMQMKTAPAQSSTQGQTFQGNDLSGLNTAQYNTGSNTTGSSGALTDPNNNGGNRMSIKDPGAAQKGMRGTLNTTTTGNTTTSAPPTTISNSTASGQPQPQPQVAQPQPQVVHP